MDENLIKISELSEKVTLDGSEYFPIQDGSTTKKAKTSNFATSADLDKKVDKEDGKVLSTNDFTDEDKSKLDGINTEELLTKTEASSTYQAKGDYITSEEIGTSPAIEDIKSNYATKSEISNKIAGDGVTSIKVVTELPGVQESNVLYIVIPQE